MTDARERAFEAIARAENTLATPRPTGALWQGADQERSSPPQAPTSAESAKWTALVKRIAAREADSVLHAVAKATQRVLATTIAEINSALDRRDERIAELESRLAAVEGLLERAKGRTQ